MILHTRSALSPSKMAGAFHPVAFIGGTKHPILALYEATSIPISSQFDPWALNRNSLWCVYIKGNT